MHRQRIPSYVTGAYSHNIKLFVVNGVDGYLAYLRVSLQLDGRVVTLQHGNVYNIYIYICVCVCVCVMANRQGSLRQHPLYVFDYVT
jgi:hypothetical protein